MYYDDIFLQNGFIDMLCKISNQFVERLDVLSFDDVRPLDHSTTDSQIALSVLKSARSHLNSACNH